MNNKLREILCENRPSIATRIESRWGLITEAAAFAKCFDYVEYVAEYAPFGPEDFENVARACELHGMGSIAKVDFQNMAWTAQKALAAGIQGILFTDCKTAQEVAECVHVTMPDSPEYGGRFGYPNYRWINYHPNDPQIQHAQEVKDCVRLFMIEKKEAVDNIREICRVPGVDMIQFGPSDYSMSRGVNARDIVEEWKQAEAYCIKVALEEGVAPRCEIATADAAQYYIELGVKHFCLADELKILRDFWASEGGMLAEKVR